MLPIRGVFFSSGRVLGCLPSSWCLVSFPSAWCLVSFPSAWCLVSFPSAWCLVSFPSAWCLVSFSSPFCLLLFGVGSLAYRLRGVPLVLCSGVRLKAHAWLVWAGCDGCSGRPFFYAQGRASPWPRLFIAPKGSDRRSVLQEAKSERSVEGLDSGFRGDDLPYWSIVRISWCVSGKTVFALRIGRCSLVDS
jgi:hypothetical protein